MKLIQLTSPGDYSKFYLQAELIEGIMMTRRGGSKIFLTTGNEIECVESPDRVASMVNINENI